MAVREWFADQEILLTGVTSDIGNAVLEKLLRSSPGIKTIYVVLRSKNCLTAENRLKKIFTSPGLERVIHEVPNVISRVKPLEGNLLYDHFGLSEKQILELKNITVVIHAGGPQDCVLKFCSELHNLRAAAVVISIFKQRGQIRESIAKKKMPNIPLALIRVPAIGPALKEPMPGYTSVLNGATALMIGAGYAFGSPNLPAAIIPVDLAANTLIASTWSKGTRDKERTVTIYNLPALDCTWSTLIESGRRASKKFPYPSFGIRGMTSNRWLHWFIVLMLEWLPSFLCDTFLYAISSKPRLVDHHRRIRTMLHSLEPILSRSWESDQQNVKELNDQLTSEDQEEYYIQPEIDFETYVLCSAAGAKKLCENDRNLKVIWNFKIGLLISIILLLVFAVFIK